MINTSALTVLLSLMFAMNGLAQDKMDQKSDKWHSLYEENGLEIEFMRSDCDNQANGMNKEEIYLRFTNTTNQVMKVRWEYDLTYNTGQYNTEGGNEEMIQTIMLPANGSKEGTCGDRNEEKLKFMVRFLGIDNNTLLNDFNVKNIEIL